MENQKENFVRAAVALVAKKKIDIGDAMRRVANEQPDLYIAYIFQTRQQPVVGL